MKTFPTTNGGRLLARGDTFDYECSRTTHRLQRAHAVLRSLDAEFTRVHADGVRNQGTNWSGHVTHECTDQCTGSWPEWVEGDLLDQVYATASKAVSARGLYNRTSKAGV